MAEPDLLFLAGLARSGTTALNRVLADHPDLAIGLERFKGLWSRRVEEITPALFERDRFFDFGDGLTNLTPELPWAAERIAALEAKWDTARYHGDKMTTIRAQRMWEQLPDAWFVFIVRDVAAVASSWQRRDADAGDRAWRAGADALDAVPRWNTAVRRIRRAVRTRPDRACVVDYESFFADPDAGPLRAVCAFLGIDPGPVLGSFTEAHGAYVSSVRDRDRSLTADVAAAVDAEADRAAYADVLELCVR